MAEGESTVTIDYTRESSCKEHSQLSRIGLGLACADRFRVGLHKSISFFNNDTEPSRECIVLLIYVLGLIGTVQDPGRLRYIQDPGRLCSTVLYTNLG